MVTSACRIELNHKSKNKEYKQKNLKTELTSIYWVIGVRLPVIADLRIQKFNLKKVVNELEKDE